MSEADSNRRRAATATKGLRWTRRGWLAAASGAVAGAAARAAPAAEDEAAWRIQSDRAWQSVVQWCFQPLDIATLARHASAIGLRSVELVDPKDWPVLKAHGLVCAISRSHTFVRGLNNREHHAECTEKLAAAIESTGAAGWPNVITFSGMREGLSDEQGKTNMIAGLKKVLPLAEKEKVNICIEPLNTRVDVEMKGHPGYQCDTIEWAVDVCDRVGSERLKILFDVYHVQIMQGDVITRIRQFKDYIAHYHTAGVPGRGELDDRQELNYPAIMRAIVETGYKGYVGHEFIAQQPDKIAALRQAARLCDV